jgi:hypothetical protein
MSQAFGHTALCFSLRISEIGGVDGEIHLPPYECEWRSRTHASRHAQCCRCQPSVWIFLVVVVPATEPLYRGFPRQSQRTESARASMVRSICRRMRELASPGVSLATRLSDNRFQSDECLSIEEWLSCKPRLQHKRCTKIRRNC